MRRSIAPMRQRGSGSITTRTTKRGEVFYGQWWLTPTQKASRRLGTVRQPGSKTGLSRNMAEAELRRLMATVQPAAEPEDGAGIRFPEAGKKYLTYLKRQGRKKSTLTAVESCLRVWAIPHFGRKPLERVTYDDIETLIAKMEERGLSPKSIGNYIGTISALYGYGMRPRVEWVTSNPCEGVDLPAVEESSTIRFLTPEQVDALIRCVPEVVHHGPNGMHTLTNHYADLDRVLYRVAAMTGLRQGELVALQWQDVDWTVGKIRVRRSYVLSEMTSPKSRRSSRAVPMGLEVQQALAAWQPHDATDADLVFADPITAGPLSNAAILRRFRRALKAAGLPASHRFHDLRHTFGTAMAGAGVPIRSLKEFMGHRDVQTTMRYADYAPSTHEVAMVDAAFARPSLSGLDASTIDPRNRARVVSPTEPTTPED